MKPKTFSGLRWILNCCTCSFTPCGEVWLCRSPLTGQCGGTCAEVLNSVPDVAQTGGGPEDALGCSRDTAMDCRH